MIFLTIDIEPMDKLYPQEKAYSWLNSFDKFICKKKIATTLFITPDIFQKYPMLVKKWSFLNEIGLHVHPLYLGYENDYLNSYNPKIITKIITKAFNIAKKYYKGRIVSFRAARWMFHNSLPDILSKLSFSYDSSIFPNAFSKNIPKRINKIIEISPSIWAPFPLKVLHKLGFFSSGGFVLCDGLLKTTYHKMIYPATKIISLKHHLIFACHSFNFEDKIFVKRFNKYLEYLTRQNQKFAKIKELKI